MFFPLFQMSMPCMLMNGQTGAWATWMGVCAGAGDRVAVPGGGCPEAPEEG